MPTPAHPARPRSGGSVRVLLAIKGLGNGGAERLVADTVRHGDHRAFQYEVAFVLESADALAATVAADGTRVHRLGARGDLDLRWTAALRGLLTDNDFDVVHFHLPYTAGVGRIVVATLPRRRRPVTVYTEHSLWNKVRSPVRMLNRATIRRDGALIAVSGSAYDSLPAALRPGARVIVHGIDLSRSRAVLARRTAARDSLRAELGLPVAAQLAVTVAGLRREKGYDVLLDAARLVKDRGVPITFAAAGAGSLERELAGRHRELELGEHFRFLGHRGDSLDLLAAADVVVLPSHQEGLPVVLMEATSVGAPIVATSVGGVPQVITDGKNGLLVAPGDPGQLADALERVSADQELRTELGRLAMATSVRFDAVRASEEIEDCYRRLLAAREDRVDG